MLHPGVGCTYHTQVYHNPLVLQLARYVLRMNTLWHDIRNLDLENT